MSYTPGFIRSAGNYQGSPRLLVQIDLTDPSARTLRLSYAEVGFGGVGYHGAIEEADAIEEPGEFLTTGYQQCAWTFSCLDVWLPGQLRTDTFAKLLSAYRFRGAAITAQQWDATDPTTDAATMFLGVINGYGFERGRVTFECVQRRDWNKTLDPVRCTIYKFPRAPQKSLGGVIPTVIGKGAAQPLRGDYGRILGPSRNNFDHNGGGIPTSRGLLVDIGRGSGDKGKVLVASHALSSIGQGSLGTNFFGQNGAGAAPSVIDPNVADIINAATGAGFVVPDDTGTFFLPIFPVDIPTLANTADNARAILDPGNETTFALLDQAAGKYYLTAQLPDVPPEGTLVDFWIVFGYKSNAAIGDIRFIFANLASGNSQLFSPLASTTEIVAFQIANLYWPADLWSLGQCELRWQFLSPGAAGNAGVTMRCHTFGVILQYKPRAGGAYAAALAAWKAWQAGRRPPGFKADWKHPHHYQGPPNPGPPPSQLPWMDQYTYYANANGPLDDGSGTDTGTASALILRAPDIAKYLLRTYCAQAGGQFETGIGALGSFVDARDQLVTWNRRTMEHFLTIDDEMQTVDVLEQLARDSVSVVHLGRSDAKFRWTPFVVAPTTTFPRIIEPEDVIDLELLKLETMPDANLISSVSVSYLFDVSRSNYASESFCSGKDSRSGYAYASLRDESIVVVANESDRFDWRAGNPGIVYTATLTPGTYDPWTFAKHLQARMQAASPETAIIHYGPRIEANYNSKLDINDGANKTLSVSTNDFTTFEDLCDSIQAGLNFLSSNWSVIYNRTTRKVTIDRSSGTKILKGLTGPSAASILGVLGIAELTSQTCPVTSEVEVEEQRFVVTDRSARLIILNETGPNGLNSGAARAAGALLGMPLDRDSFPASTSTTCVSGTCPKSTREYTLAAVEAKYGARRPHQLTAKTILDTDTAREARNRIIDLGGAPRPMVSLRSARIRDMERYHVVELSSRFDPLVPYTEEGTDGSWAGKKFWVVNLRHYVGPDRWDSEATLVRG